MSVCVGACVPPPRSPPLTRVQPQDAHEGVGVAEEAQLGGPAHAQRQVQAAAVAQGSRVRQALQLKRAGRGVCARAHAAELDCRGGPPPALTCSAPLAGPPPSPSMPASSRWPGDPMMSRIVHFVSPSSSCELTAVLNCCSRASAPSPLFGGTFGGTTKPGAAANTCAKSDYTTPNGPTSLPHTPAP